MSRIQISSFLRAVLLTDAAASAATGVLLCAGAPFLDRLLGLPGGLLVSAGLPLLPFAALVAWIGTRAVVPRNAIRFVVGSNALWVVGSIALLLSRVFEPTLIGVAFVIVQAIAVAAFAECQVVGLRRVAA